MFGALRLLLAYLVVVSHLVGTPYVAHFGYYAVRGFFVLSGFMMTSALNEVYAFDVVRFWTNRALRLLPPYYVVCLATLIVVAIAPDQASRFLKFWRGEPTLGDLVANFTVLPLQLPTAPFRLVPPFWSVAIEIDMYLLLFLIVSRRMAWAFIALCAGLSFQLVCTYDGLGRGVDYFTAPSAVFPFAIGAMLYFLRQREMWIAGPRAAGLAFILWLGNMAAGGALLPDAYVFGPGYLVDTICIAVVVSGLAGLGDREPGALATSIDARLGELSYFVFLSHWLAGFVVASVVLGGAWRGWTLLAASTPAIVLASAAFARLNRVVIEPLRSRIRGRAMDSQGRAWLGVSPAVHAGDGEPRFVAFGARPEPLAVRTIRPGERTDSIPGPFQRPWAPW